MPMGFFMVHYWTFFVVVLAYLFQISQAASACK